ncbi:MAG: arginine--tRNA ligase [Spirochaetota bacterium]|nr:arginine--tRNA ligase [Spirochaetota bacterium]
MLIKERIKDLIEHSCMKAVSDNRISAISFPSVKIEYPKDEKHGDYSTPLALESAKILKESPMGIGSILKEYIEGSEIIEKIEVVKPGFINIFLSLDFLHKTLISAIDEGENYGKCGRGTPKMVNIEFVSANPTGPLNIVSARAAALGDTLANLLEARGDVVDREYYINDYGNQVYLLGKSVLHRCKEIMGERIDFPEDGYHGEYIKDIARYLCENHKEETLSFDNEDDQIDYISRKAVDYNVRGHKSDLERFNVRFDTWYNERSLHESGKVTKTLDNLETKGVIYNDNGKRVFEATAFGDDKDRVVVRDDNRPTYLLADIAYHKDKMERGYDLLIDIWGPDHHGYISRIVGAMKALEFDEDMFRILIAQQVNLIMDGELVKMSKRLGKFSTMSELIDEIGVDVARYFFIMRSLDSHLDFDLALAKKQSSENPVFYLQYAHARICSIFREAEKIGTEYFPSGSTAEYLNNPEAIALLKRLALFPEEIFDAAFYFEPHRLANYLLKLAQGFHKFYTEHRVLSTNREMTNAYLSLCDGVRIVLNNGLKLLGISAPEMM